MCGGLRSFSKPGGSLTLLDVSHSCPEATSCWDNTSQELWGWDHSTPHF